MAVNLSPIGNGQQFFDNNGLPLAGGYIYTYQAGSTTPLSTFTDITGSIANSNPIVLDASGRTPSEVWLTYGFNYKFVVQSSTNTSIGTYDNIYGIVGVQSSTGTTIPSGMISLWYGSIGSIPAGWYLCDGTNGTPDLRDRFIVGAGNSYSVAATGGATSVTLSTANMPAHSHTATSVVTDPGHFHSYTQPASGTLVSNINGFNAGAITGNTGSANTGISVATSIGNTGSGSSFNILNPYYALAYIMKA